VEVLQWLRAQDPPCPWDERTFRRAARNGRLEVLQWLRAQDPPCPWDARALAYATEEGHDDVVAWLNAQNAPVPVYLWEFLAQQWPEMLNN
jgi:hypothetical protein